MNLLNGAAPGNQKRRIGPPRQVSRELLIGARYDFKGIQRMRKEQK